MSFTRAVAAGVVAMGMLYSVSPSSGSGDSGAAGSANDSRPIEAFTEPYRDIDVAAGEMGTVASVDVAEGDFVTAGSILATLDSRVLKTSLDVAQAGASATGQLDSALAEVERHQEELEKLIALQSRNHASQREVDRIRTQLRVAECRVQTVREERAVRELECKRIQAQLEQRIVRSPINGIVTSINRDPGEFVSLSDAVVVRVVQLDPLLIVFSVPLSQRGVLTRGQQVPLVIGQERHSANGIVEFVSPTADESSSGIHVKVRLPNPDGKWQSGEPAVLLLNGETAAPAAGISPLASRQK